jgi:hypothetical protein
MINATYVNAKIQMQNVSKRRSNIFRVKYFAYPNLDNVTFFLSLKLSPCTPEVFGPTTYKLEIN